MPRVLVIEDNEVNQDLVARFLGIYGYDVDLAADGCTGIQIAGERQRDIVAVLLDMNLPDIDGWEVARRLKTSSDTADLPLIAVTAHAMVGDREKVIAAGCDDYVTKPIDFNILIQKLEDIISKTKLL